MIKVDINIFFGVVITGILCYFFIKEFLLKRLLDTNVSWLGKSKYAMHCPFCTHVYFDYVNKDVSLCPQCESYVKISVDDTEN